MRRDVQRWRGANARAEKHNGMFASFASQRVERSGSRGRDPLQPRWTSAAAESRIIHSPDFYGALVPHLGFSRDPAIGTIRVTIKSQHVDFGVTALLGETRSRRPHFHFTLPRMGRFFESRRAD